MLGDQKEIQEVKNAYAAYEKLPGINPYDMSDLYMLGKPFQILIDPLGIQSSLNKLTQLYSYGFIEYLFLNIKTPGSLHSRENTSFP